MKHRLILAATTLAFLAPLSAATYDTINGYSGAQTIMLPTDANVSTADPLIFAVTTGYFNNGNSTKTYTNANVRIDNLSMNNGYSGSVTIFTGTVTGAGNITQITAGTGQDFVFAGSMSGYAGNISIANTGSAANTNLSTTLGDGLSAIVQFGGATAGGTTALGTTSVDGSSKNYINNVSGTGSITAVNLVYNYAAAAGTYSYVLASNNISAYQLAQTGGATVVYTGTISGRNATISGNSISVTGGTAVIRGAVGTMGTISVNGGTLVTGNVQALNASVVNITSGVLQIGDGTTNTVTLASAAALTVADGATLKFLTAAASIALNGATATLGTSSVITLDLSGAFNSAGAYNLLSGGTVTNTAVTLAGFDSAHYAATFSAGVLTVTAVPEPSAYGLIGAGALAGIALARRRKRA